MKDKKSEKKSPEEVQVIETKEPPTEVKLDDKIHSIPDKLEAVILRKIGNTHVKIGSKKIKSTDTSFRFLSGDKAVTFIVPKNVEINYSDGKRSYIFYDFNSGLLPFTKSDFPLTIEETDDLLSKNVIAGLFNKIKGSLEKPDLGSAILKYVIVAIAFTCIGWIAHEAVNPPQTAKMIGVLAKWLM